MKDKKQGKTKDRCEQVGRMKKESKDSIKKENKKKITTVELVADRAG